MEEGAEPEARSAALGLLDFAHTALGSHKAAGQREQPRTSTSGRDPPPSPATASPRLAVATVTSSGLGRLITSGDNSLASRHSQEPSTTKQSEARKKGEFKQPPPRRAEQKERVTVIVQKPAQPRDQKGASNLDSSPADPAVSTVEVPVPASAFASLIGSGDSGKSSTDFTPFATSAAVKEDSGSDGETESDEQKGSLQCKQGEEKRPAKKRRLARTVSINTVLQQVDARDPPLAEAVGSVPQTVQEIVPGISTKQVDTLKIVEKLWGSGATAPTPIGPSLPPRKSSDQSTMDAQKQIAQTESGSVIDADPSSTRSSKGIKRAFSAERALHLPPKPPTAAATPTSKAETSPTSGPQAQHLSAAAAKEPNEDDPKTVMWTGKVKHRLKTAEVASIVELFDLSALVPERLLEQMPPALFVNGLAGRANVKLGKHYVMHCRLGALSARQKQKVTALATMKLVAICELQHCTLTLVPFNDSHNHLRIVGFIIADD